MSEKTIKQVVHAKSGSKLEKAVLQILQDMKANIARLKENYKTKSEKQQNKIDRRL